MRIFRLLILLMVLAPISAVSAEEMNMSSMPQAQKIPMPEAPLKTSFVCMMNNAYMGVEQIPVEVDGKTYYGCCEGCKTTLKINAQARTATDPFSGKAVDKASAFIAPMPNGGQKVLYFESKENYEGFLKTGKSNS